MRRLFLVLSLVAVLSPAVAAQEPAHPHGYVPHTEELKLPPRLEIPGPETPSPDVPLRPLSVQEAVDIALLHQPAIGMARGNLRTATGHTREVAAGLNPSLSLSATDTPISSLIAGGGSISSSLGSFSATSLVSSTGIQGAASVKQLLFDFDKTRLMVEQARAQQSAALESLHQANNDVVLQVEQAFYGLRQTEAQIDVYDTDVRNQREHLQQAQALYQSGVGLPAEVVRAENAVATALINLKQAQGDADNARVTLAFRLGVDPRTPLTAAPGDLARPADKPLGQWVDQALQIRPEVRSALALVAADRDGLQAAARTNAPSLSATASVSTLPNPLQNSQQLELLTAAVSVQWAFGDGGVTSGRIEQAAGTLDTARSQLDATRSTVVMEVTQAYVNLQTAEEKLRLSNVAVSTGEENLRLARGRYGAGLGLSIDVLDAESALVTSLTSQVNQQSAVDLARAALLHAVGGLP